MHGPISSTMKRIWKKIRKSPSYRDSYVSAHISNTVAAQISSMREDREWTQSQLAEKTGMKQSRISTLEDPNYENVEIATLKRIASAFEVALTIRFVPFSELMSWAEHHTMRDLNVRPIEKDALQDVSWFTPDELHRGSQNSASAPIITYSEPDRATLIIGQAEDMENLKVRNLPYQGDWIRPSSFEAIL
jgi:transcriptional regulator with XRE-family HTH domain